MFRFTARVQAMARWRTAVTDFLGAAVDRRVGVVSDSGGEKIHAGGGYFSFGDSSLESLYFYVYWAFALGICFWIVLSAACKVQLSDYIALISRLQSFRRFCAT